MPVLKEVLVGDSVIVLFKINESSVQPGKVAWLNGAGRVLQVPEDEHGVWCVQAWVETKLCVWHSAF